MRLLVVEDEPDIAQFIRQGLCEAGYAVDVAGTGRAGLGYTLVTDYDMVLLDLLLPEVDGLQFLRELRQRSDKVPVLILTALGAIDKRVQGLDAGADDYLVKPFAFSELLARIRALLRRPPLQLDTLLQIGELVMDVARYEVRFAGKLIDLSQREFMLLEYLMRHPNQVLTRTQIAEHVWNFDFQNDSNVVDVYIGYLRRKITRTGDLSLIQTVRGMGYRLQADLAHG